MSITEPAGPKLRKSSYCSNCGNPLDVGVRFCSKCGGPVSAPVEPSDGAPFEQSLTPQLASDGLGELERLVREYPDDESYQKLLAVELHDDAMKDWWKDPEDGQLLCTSFKQIQHARRQLDRAAALQFNDPHLRNNIASLRDLAEAMEKRKYAGNWPQIIILGIFYIFPGVIWWYVNRRPVFLINRDYVREIQTGKHPGAGARMGGAMEKVSNFFDSVTGGWGGFFALAFMVIFSPIFMILAFKQNYIDVSKEYELS